jgi:hypothetical protein
MRLCGTTVTHDCLHTSIYVDFAGRVFEFCPNSLPMHDVDQCFSFADTTVFFSLLTPTVNFAPKWRISFETSAELSFHHYHTVRLSKLRDAERLLLWNRHFVTRPSFWRRRLEKLPCVNLKQTLRVSLAIDAYHMILCSRIIS